MELLRQRLERSLPDSVDEPILHTCIFDGHETQYLQHKYYKENFSYIVSYIYYHLCTFITRTLTCCIPN